MANKSFRGFPHRRDETYTRRAFNMDYAPRYADLGMWFDASRDVYADGAATIPANPGDAIALVKDQGPYGRHMGQLTTAQQPYLLVDNGFFAINTQASQRHLYTSASFGGTTLVFAVFRSTAAAWTNYGAVLGQATTRQQLFASGGTGFYGDGLPTSILRRNGVDLLLSTSSCLAPINVPFLLTFNWRGPATVAQASIGKSDNTFYVDLMVYEILAYTSLLTSGDITDIEAMLMAKYNLS